MGSIKDVLRNGEIYFRRFSTVDVEPLVEIINKPATIDLAVYQGPINRESGEHWYETHAAPDVCGSSHYFAVWTESDAFVGLAFLWNLNGRMPGYEMSIVLDTDLAGKGYGYSSTKLCVDFCFEYTNIHRVWMSTLVRNKAALKMAQKSGFSIEGTIREFARRKGIMEDAYLLAVLRREWDAEKLTPTRSKDTAPT